jgi:hypothetical protein
MADTSGSVLPGTADATRDQLSAESSSVEGTLKKPILGKMNNPWGSSKRLVNDKLGSVMSPESVESSHGDAGEAGDHDLRVATG